MPTYTNNQIATALTTTRGMVYLAAKELACSPNTIKARLKKSESLRVLQVALRGETTDVAEQKLYDAIKEGDPWAIQFYLKTQAKDRGYTERTEISGPDGGPIEHEVNAQHVLLTAINRIAERVGSDPSLNEPD